MSLIALCMLNSAIYYIAIAWKKQFKLLVKMHPKMHFKQLKKYLKMIL